MPTKPEIEGVDVVLRGSFNPAIFTPAWFCARQLLPKTAEDGATLHIAHPQICAFEFEWLRFRVDDDRFQLATTMAPHVRVRNLVSAVFRDHLPHTPLHVLGINRSMHFLVDNPTLRDTIGKSLAPPAAWGEWAEQADGGVGSFGMTSLTMTQNQIEGRSPKDTINVTVQPSLRVGEGKQGVYVSVNDHYENIDQGGDAPTLMNALEKEFEASLKRSEELIDHVASLQHARKS